MRHRARGPRSARRAERRDGERGGGDRGAARAGGDDVAGVPDRYAREAFLCDFDFVRFRFRFRLVSSGPFYTSESRGEVERRQLKLKGAEDGY